MYRYTVCCQFTKNDPSVIEKWLAWLHDPHIADVMKGGATGAEVVKLAGEVPTFEIRYQFSSQAEFAKYEAEFAPNLKSEGRALFPPEELGMVYSRTNGQVVHSTLG